MSHVQTNLSTEYPRIKINKSKCKVRNIYKEMKRDKQNVFLIYLHIIFLSHSHLPCTDTTVTYFITRLFGSSNIHEIRVRTTTVYDQQFYVHLL